MALAFSYIRFSTPEQLKGDSLRRQFEWSEDYCRKHKHTLDTSLKLRDLGVSAFKSRHAKKGALAGFLEAVEQGRVKSGSLLLVESLDRLSRDQIGEALELFLGILRKGIKIVTRFPEDEFDKSSINDVAKILTAIIYMSRAHEESATKSKRLTEAWKAKRAKLSEMKMTRRCPAWLDLNEQRTKYILIPEKVALVKRIYKMADEGFGLTSIVKKLNGEGIKSLARVPHWQHSYVLKILRNRAVIGEYQPCVGHWSSRKPLGDPIADYYPPVIDTGLFYRVQEGLTRRVTHHGRKGEHVRNLFTGLIRDEQDGCTMSVIDKGGRSSGPVLVSTGARRGSKGSKYVSFPYAVFENAFLRWTEELKVKDIIPSSADLSAIEEQLEEAKGTLADLNHKIGKAKARMLGDGDFDALADVLRTLENRKKETEATIERLTTELQSERDTSIASAKHLIRELDEAQPGERKEELRTRLKARIADCVEEIRMSVKVHRPPNEKEVRIATVQVRFYGGKTRTYGIVAKNAGGSGAVIGSISDPRERWGIEDKLPRGYIPKVSLAEGSTWVYASLDWSKIEKLKQRKGRKAS